MTIGSECPKVATGGWGINSEKAISQETCDMQGCKNEKTLPNDRDGYDYVHDHRPFGLCRAN
jgi:hypothetical protein